MKLISDKPLKLPDTARRIHQHDAAKSRSRWGKRKTR